jgi:hypothetical protein
MTNNNRGPLLIVSMLLFASLGLTALAADRIRPGQWVGTTVVGGKTYPTSSCMSPTDTAALNGDAKAVLGYLEKTIPPEICKITDVKVDGAQIVYTASCGKGGSKVVTTAYHGDHSEGTDSTGGKTEAKLVGPCKS